jgi:tetratricopeptide (TPR) repeat protein
VLRANPGFDGARLWLGRTFESQGRYDDSIRVFLEARTLQRFPVLLAALGHAYGAAGRREEAEGVLRRMDELSRELFVTPYGIALVQAGLGRDDDALASLRRAYEGRSHWLVWMRLDPRWGKLRDDPRFDAIAKAVGL